jgi:hypothetical protein
MTLVNIAVRNLDDWDLDNKAVDDENRPLKKLADKCLAKLSPVNYNNCFLPSTTIL